MTKFSDHVLEVFNDYSTEEHTSLIREEIESLESLIKSMEYEIDTNKSFELLHELKEHKKRLKNLKKRLAELDN